MSIREADIRTRLQRFLARRSMPTALAGKDDAIRDEVQALVRAIARYAPNDMGEWWGRLEDAVSQINTTRSWPTEGEFAKAAKMIAQPKATSAGGESTADPMKITARRIEEGAAVGDEWLYGRRAVELVAQGLATDGALRRYRSALFFSMKDAWGEDKARRVEADMIRRHEDAERPHRDAARSQRSTYVPNKRVAPDAEVFV